MSPLAATAVAGIFAIAATIASCEPSGYLWSAYLWLAPPPEASVRGDGAAGRAGPGSGRGRGVLRRRARGPGLGCGARAGPRRAAPRVDRDVMVATVQENAHRHHWDDWDEVRCPVLVVRGENGAMKPDEVDRMRARHPGTRIGVIPGAGHDAHLDNTAAVYGEMTAFLAQLPA
ncbi:alpha/beta fold hydrolase [Streptomyces anulatus]